MTKYSTIQAEIGSLIITPSQIKILKKELGIDILKIHKTVQEKQMRNTPGIKYK